MLLENRREFLCKAPSRVTAVVAAASLVEGILIDEAAAKTRERTLVCVDEARRDPLISAACKPGRIEDPEDRIVLIEALRSAPAFREFSGDVAVL